MYIYMIQCGSLYNIGDFPKYTDYDVGELA